MHPRPVWRRHQLGTMKSNASRQDGSERVRHRAACGGVIACLPNVPLFVICWALLFSERKREKGGLHFLDGSLEWNSILVLPTIFFNECKKGGNTGVKVKVRLVMGFYFESMNTPLRRGWCCRKPKAFPLARRHHSTTHTDKAAKSQGHVGASSSPRAPFPHTPALQTSQERDCHPPHGARICFSHLVTALSCSEIVRRVEIIERESARERSKRGTQPAEGRSEEKKRRPKETHIGCALSMTHTHTSPTLQRRRLTGLYVHDFSPHGA